MSVVYPDYDRWDFYAPGNDGSDTSEQTPAYFNTNKGHRMSAVHIRMTEEESLGPYSKVARIRTVDHWTDAPGTAQFNYLHKGREGGSLYRTNRNFIDYHNINPGDIDTIWPLKGFNRMRQFFKYDGEFDMSQYGHPQEGGPMNAPGTLGTYVRHPIKNSIGENATDFPRATPGYTASGHCYHYFSVHGGGLWSQITASRAPDTARDWQKGPDGPIPTYMEQYALQGYPGYDYFDCLSDHYLQIAPPGIMVPEKQAFYGYVVGIEYYYDPLSINAPTTDDRLERLIRSLQATYDPVAKKLHIGCSLLYQQEVVPGTPGFTARVAYKFGDTTYPDSFDTLTPLTELTHPGGLNDYSWFNHSYDFDFGAEEVAYIALAVKTKETEYGHREIAVTKDNNALPPLPGQSPA